MTDTPLTISFTGPLAADLRAAADACDLAVEDYIKRVLMQEVQHAGEALGWNNDEGWEEDVRRLNEPGENIPAEQVFAEIRERLKSKRRKT